MASSLTVTGKVLGDITVTAKVISNVASFRVDIQRGMLFVTDTGDVTQEYDISAATTFTVTISGGAYTIAIS